MSCTFSLPNCVSPQQRAFFRHFNFKKCFENVFFNIHFQIRVSQRRAFFSAPELQKMLRQHVRFVTQRAFFRHLNFKKCSDNVIFFTFSLPNVRFATAACIFSSELQKVLQERQFFLKIFTSKSAFRQSDVQFLMSSLSILPL